MKILAEYKKSLIVKEEDIDELNHVNNAVYVKWVQDIAKEHWETTAPVSVQKEVFWVVVNHHINYKKPCFLGDYLKIRTQVIDDAAGATWGRNVWIYNPKGELAAEAKTKWCLIDVVSQRPKRITEEFLKIFITENQ